LQNCTQAKNSKTIATYTPHTQTLAAHFFKPWDHTVRMSTSKKQCRAYTKSWNN